MIKRQYMLAAIVLIAISTPKIAFSSSREELGEALLLAIRVGEFEHAHELISTGADVDCVSPGGNTPLLFASSRSPSHKATKLIKALLNAGSDVNHINDIGDNALVHAMQSANESALKLLLNAGTPPLSRQQIEKLYNIYSAKSFEILQLQNKISKERRESLGQWCEYIDEEYDVPPVIQQLIVRDMLGTVPEQMPAL